MTVTRDNKPYTSFIVKQNIKLVGNTIIDFLDSLIDKYCKY